MHEIFAMIRKNDLQALSEVSDDLSFLIDPEKHKKTFEEVKKTENKVHQTCSALYELVQKLFSKPLLKERPALAPSK
jgi:hypothetical protein